MSEPSYTKLVESGAFVRTLYRKGTKRKQETRRMKKNDEKVVLGMLGDLEVYVYPYNFPSTVFIGKFPISTQITQQNRAEVITAARRIRWFLDGEWNSSSNQHKDSKTRRHTMIKAYNTGLKHQKERENSRILR